MKAFLEKTDKAFESRVRLGIMAVLAVNDKASFNTLKELLGLTDGNLSSHLRGLEQAGYVAARKRFIGRKPNTRYSATARGRQAFKAHLAALEEYLRSPLAVSIEKPLNVKIK
jgi:DNA-binding MarR family transcriptional regulator